MDSKYSGELRSRTRSLKSLLLRPLQHLRGGGRSSDYSSRVQRIYKYDVFLSFGGTDTRKTFIDHLYNHLIRKGIFVFKDDKKLEKGEPISQQLLQAIKDSRVSIIVFSQHYAASTWCLDEMAIISDCQENFKQIVFPVFYDVDPSDVRKQNGAYENAFALHSKNFKKNPAKVDRWKRAMTGLANTAGWDVRNKHEFSGIEKIVQAVVQTLGHKFSGFADDLIGVQPRVDELENLLKLNLEDDGFRVLGIWGMGGIGKTTHAKVLYDRISCQFDAACFIENVSQISKDGDVIDVQKQILRQALQETNLETYTSSEISGIIRNRIHNIKVLIVLDNVDELQQLEKLAIDPKLLCSGSRVVITTRDDHILKLYEANTIHEIPLLNNNEAYELFLRKAFKSDDPMIGIWELIPKILSYTQRLPLAIRVMGSFLFNRDVVEWLDALDRLGNNPDNQIMNVLQISFEGLKLDEKEIFLYIACFFNGESEDYVKRILNACGLHPHIGIRVMIEKSLITIKNQEIYMHEMLQELGKKIVREKSPEEPGQWSRLWCYKDFHYVLTSETGTNNIKAIVLNQEVDGSIHDQLRAEELSKMRSLKLLIFHQRNFYGRLNFLSNSLHYLLWHGYPFTSLPLNFQPNKLVELNMSNSNMEKLWEGIKYLPSLKRLDLSNSKYLMAMPNFEGMANLERLDLTGCTKLTQVHPSIGLLQKLAFLSLRNCINLLSLYLDRGSSLSSLTVLYLSSCIALVDTLDFRAASNLEYLDLENCTSLLTIHESIGALVKLKFLSLRGCQSLVEIPESIYTMISLITLDLCNCSELKRLPLVRGVETYDSTHSGLLVISRRSLHSSCLKSLIFLDLGFCNLSEVPDAIMWLRCLERLNLEGNNFNSIPENLGSLKSLAYLNLSHCTELQWLPSRAIGNAVSATMGTYFKTVSGSRNHRSGLYIFDCPKLTKTGDALSELAFKWLTRLLQEPRHFRCGFDIVIKGSVIQQWFNHQFNGDSTIRIVHSSVDDGWIGFAFCVAFELNNCEANSDCWSLPYPLYLSFESEHVEESFDMPLSFNKEMKNHSEHLWLIYISQPHCHFVKTGAHIKFKARLGLEIKKWGLRMIFTHDIVELVNLSTPPDLEHIKKSGKRKQVGLLHKEKYLRKLEKAGKLKQVGHLNFDYVLESDDGTNGCSPFSKIHLPYNWLVTDEDEIENMEAKEKENNLSMIGLGMPLSEHTSSSSRFG